MSDGLNAQKVNCKIIDMQPDPKRQGRMLISVQFDDGDPLGPWHQAFSVAPETVITLEDFMTELYKQDIQRPVDPYANLKQIMEAGEQFELNLQGKLEAQNAS